MINLAMNIIEIANAIKTTKINKRPLLIAIEGFGGSGKTTLANSLRDALGSAHVVNIDDFIVKEKLTEPSWDKGAFDRKRLEQQVLAPAKRGEAIDYQELIWETNTLSEPKIIPSVGYIIVEGISSSNPDIAHYYDYKIWVDTPIEIAKARGKSRDAGNENVDKWDMFAENDLAYQQKYHPELAADFIISNG